MKRSEFWERRALPNACVSDRTELHCAWNLLSVNVPINPWGRGLATSRPVQVAFKEGSS